ncbi:MAG: molybdopterin-guanine dinucleotide biosynthesis protein A [Flavobacteriaceae bacterium]|jgi:molybdopterin-guanine dinucleotide biosynthesis protein A
MTKEITGIILAGGKSTRLGTDKGLAMLNSKPLVQHSIDLLDSLNIPVLIVTNQLEYEQFGHPLVEDVYKEKGPIGGIYSGLRSSKTEVNILLSCDTPYIPLQIIERIIGASEDHEIAIARFLDQLHPLIGLYKRSLIKPLKNAIEEDRLKLISLCTELNAHQVVFESDDLISARSFTNINTLEELNNQST